MNTQTAAKNCPRCGQRFDPRFRACSCVEPNADPIPETVEQQNARVLALLALQSDRYRTDGDYRQAVDNVLADTRHVRWTRAA